jgi:hypothetical protein
MYSNSGNPFNNSEIDASGKKLRDKTYSEDQTYFESLFDSIAILSNYAGNVGSNGIPGIVTSSSGAKKYLQNANGMEYQQLIVKQLMGALLYYQGVEVYLTKLKTADNVTVVAGEGTLMEHYCDESFGYFGVPVDFPSNVSNLKYWGNYSDELNGAIGSNASIMNAFLKLRAAISNKDTRTRNSQILIVGQEWEKLVAASAIIELKDAKSNISDDALRNHYLSEAVGFIKSLKYNSAKKITQSQIDSAVAALGSNFYTISITNIDNAINAINAIYGFDLSKF